MLFQSYLTLNILIKYIVLLIQTVYDYSLGFIKFALVFIK